MKINARGIVLSCFVLGVTAAELAIPTDAHSQSTQQRIAEGTQQWGQNGWLYVVQQGRWVQTTYFRRYPDPRNYPTVFDIYQNGRFLRRVGATAPAGAGVQQANRTAADAARLQQLLAEYNRLVAIQNAQPGRRSGTIAAGSPNTIGGFGGTSPVAATGPTHAGAPGTIGGDFNSPGRYLPGSTVNVGGARTTGQDIAAMTGANWTSPFLQPNCAGSYNGCR